MVVVFASLLCVLVTLTSAQDIIAPAPSPPCYPCDPLWPRPYYYPDLSDCSIAWQCLNGQLSRFRCLTPGQVIDFVAQACVTDGPNYLFTCKKMTNTQCSLPASG